MSFLLVAPKIRSREHRPSVLVVNPVVDSASQQVTTGTDPRQVLGHCCEEQQAVTGGDA
jgi:hypothetical protein